MEYRKSNIAEYVERKWLTRRTLRQKFKVVGGLGVDAERRYRILRPLDSDDGKVKHQE
jgi:hypothetical protein